MGIIWVNILEKWFANLLRKKSYDQPKQHIKKKPGIHGVAKSGAQLSDWTELSWTENNIYIIVSKQRIIYGTSVSVRSVQFSSVAQ